MIFIECPNDLDRVFPGETVVFMAGGITGCLDWQSTVKRWVTSEYNEVDLSKVILINPRRRDFDVNDPTASEKQVEWEFMHLNMATDIYFWFPKEGKCMITLFELGWALGAGKNVAIGVEPGYLREDDIKFQLGHRRPWLKIHSSLESLYSPFMYKEPRPAFPGKS